MTTKISCKRVENLENYDVTKATEGDYIPVVGTGDGNKLGKIPVSEVRDIMAKFSVQNIVVMIMSFIESLVKRKTGVTYDGATAINTLVQYVKENWFDPATGTFNSDGMRALKDFCADGMLQLTDEAFAIIKKIWSIGDAKSDYWYLGRTTHYLYVYKSMEGEPQPDTVYVVSYVDHDKEYEEFKNTLEEAAARAAQLTGATIEEADWAGGADKQPYVFDWTKDRAADLVEAMDIKEFIEGLNPFSTFFSMRAVINSLSSKYQEMSDTILDLTSRVTVLEQALAQAQGGGSTDSPTNGGENQGEDAALRNRVEALWAQFVGTDASNMTTEEMVAALENGANITPDPNATLAERIEALEALAAAQQ